MTDCGFWRRVYLHLIGYYDPIAALHASDFARGELEKFYDKLKECKDQDQLNLILKEMQQRIFQLYDGPPFDKLR